MTIVHNMPSHVAIVMDGNGRWAQQQNKARTDGHFAAIATVRTIIESSAKSNIKVLTLFAFSCENWQRPKKEVQTLMQLMLEAIYDHQKELMDQGITVRIIGDKRAFNANLIKAMGQLEAVTAQGSRMQLNLALNYSGQWDILQASVKMAKAVKNNQLDSTALTAEHFSSYLATAPHNRVDLFIRTGGEVRISNFMLYQIAYSELYFSDLLFPDFDEVAFQQAISWYNQRQRRFGKTQEQASHKEAQNG